MGFIGGQQIKDAGLGNNGLRDRKYQHYFINALKLRIWVGPLERFAMEWVQQHISAFGGDPTKVIM